MTQHSQPDISSDSSDLIGRLVDESNDAIFVIDPVSSRFIAVNKTACVRLGYERDELLKMKVVDIEAELPDAFSWSEHVENLKQASSNVFEGEHKRKDGSCFPVEVSLKYTSSEQGDHISAIARDISSLKRSESLFRTLFDVSPLSIQIIDANGMTEQVNDSWCRMWGAELRDIADYNMLQDEQLQEKGVLPYLIRAFAGETVSLPSICYDASQNGKINSSHASACWVESWVYPIHGVDGEVQKVVLVHQDVSARKQAELQSAASEQHLRTLIELIPDAILVHQEGRIVFANSTAATMFGYETSEAVQGVELIKHVHPDGATRVKTRIEKFYVGELNNLVVEERFLSLDGSELVGELHAVRSSYNGQPAVMTVLRNITRRKQQELFELDQRHLLELIANSQTTLSTVLEATVQAVERQRPGMLGSILLLGDDGEHLHHGAAPSLPAAYCQAIDGVAIGPCVGSCGTAAFTGKRVIVSDINSDPLWADYKELALSYGLAACWSEPIRNAEGQVLGTFAMYYQQPQQPESADVQLIERAAALAANAITHKQAEEQLRLLHDAVASVNESVMITDSEGIIIYANQAFTDMSGYSQEEVLGRTPAILNSSQQAGKFYQHYWQTIKAGKPWSGRLLDRRKDGTIFPVHMSVAPIFDANDANDAITHFVAIHEDLSEYELFQKKLSQSQKMEAVGVMAGGIAHDFNNLLAGLTGNLYMMRMHNALNEEIVQRSGNMEAAIMHGAKMIQQLLTFARKDHMEMHDFDLCSFFKETHKLAAASLPENVRLTLKYDGGDTWVHGDPTQLQQLIGSFKFKVG